jgi:hypothetical protein
MLVAEFTVNDLAAVPPKVTMVAPVKLVPVIVIGKLGPTSVGVKEVILGGGIKVKPPNVPVPPGLTTDTLPEAPLPTTAVMMVGDTTVNEVVDVPPKLTAVAPVKPVPVMVTVVPTPATTGVKDVILGGGIKVKPPNVPVPPGLTTDTLPEAPLPTTAVIVVGDTTVNEAAVVPPKLTAVAPVKLVPVMVTVVPTPATTGVKDVILGGGIKVKPPNVPVPPGLTIDTLPEAPLPTTAVIVVGDTTVNEVDAVPPKLTAVAPVKPVPVMVTVVPTPAEVGINDWMEGGITL